MDKSEIEKLVDEKITDAIELRKKEVKKQLTTWSVIITSVFSFLLFIGFTTEEIIKKFRDTVIPKSHMITELLRDDDGSRQLKVSIIDELGDPTLKAYPKVKSTIETNVWEVINTTDEDKINDFLTKSSLDDQIINSYYKDFNKVLFDPAPTQEPERISQILSAGEHPKPVRIGRFINRTNAKTNCALPYRQNKKRVILYFPPSTKTKDGGDAYPWFKCPNNYPTILISLKVEDVEVTGIRVVGVERPTKEDNIRGVRARVTEEVAKEFAAKGMPIGKHVVDGSMKISDVFEL